MINGLSDQSHLGQAVADALTIKNNFGSFDDVFLTYIGDGNNVCKSLMEIAVKCGFKMAIVGPKKYAPSLVPKGIIMTDNIADVIQRTNVIYTDVWVSMGDESESHQRVKDFMPYQVTMNVIQQAKKDQHIFTLFTQVTLVEEVTEDVFESSFSKVFDQAENRLHAQNSIMSWLIENN